MNPPPVYCCYKLEFRYSGGWYPNAWYPELQRAVNIALRSIAAYEYRITLRGNVIKQGFLDAHRMETRYDPQSSR